MLVQFKFENFKCFKKLNTLSLVAGKYKRLRRNNIDTSQDYSLLPWIGLYGENASGKSKAFQAFQFFKNFVLTSSEENKYSNPIPITPFRLDEDSVNLPSTFEVIFLLNSIQFRYGIEITKDCIEKEWLYRKKERETPIFRRLGIDFECNKRYISKIESNIRNQNMLHGRMLLLSGLSQWQDPLSKSITNLFKNVNVISSAFRDIESYSNAMLITPMKNVILSLLSEADLSISDLTPNEVDIDSLPKEIRKVIPEEALSKGKIYDSINSAHIKYNKNGEKIGEEMFHMETDESYGTNAFFALTAPIIDTLKNGKILFIDEIDKGLHPNLVEAIIKLFESTEINKKHAQLIFNTHNTALLRRGNEIGYDQIYVVNKNRYGQAYINCISDYKNIKKNHDNLEVMYQTGRFGGIPNLTKFGYAIKANDETLDK